jgi:chaperonin cofactor prefoldin
MHHTHFFRVQGDSHADAFDNVEGHIADWGDENNWRTFLGAMHLPTREVKPTSDYINWWRRTGDVSQAKGEYNEAQQELTKTFDSMEKYLDSLTNEAGVKASVAEIRQNLDEFEKVDDWLPIYRIEKIACELHYRLWRITAIKSDPKLGTWDAGYRDGSFEERGYTLIDEAGEYIVAVDIHT